MVLYLVCFDLSGSLDDQITQISYWLDFLNSSLPLPPPPSSPLSNWGIILVGLRADLKKPSVQQIQLHHITALATRWPRLSILNKQVFTVSSFTSEASVRQLLDAIEGASDSIFSKHAIQIPSSFRSTLERIQASPPPSDLSLTTEQTLYAEFGNEHSKYIFSLMLKYFNSIGHIAILKGGLICTDPQQIVKLAAKFVSPEEVRLMLWKRETENVQILTEKDVGTLLAVPDSASEKYVQYIGLSLPIIFTILS